MSRGPEEFKAIDEFLRRCMVPILWEQHGQRRLCGTGTLFSVNGRWYIVTAGHVFTDENGHDLDFSSLGIPLRPDGRAEIWTFGQSVVHRSEERNDIGVISLDDEEFVDQIQRAWRFLSPGNLTGDWSHDEEFLVAGYLGATTRLVGDRLTGDFNTFLARRYKGDAGELKAPVDFAAEFFLRHDGQGRTLKGTVEETPPFEGISGAAVWALRAPPRSAATCAPESAMKIVGVETHCKRGVYVRVKKWNLVARVFEMIDAAAVAEIADALSR